MQRAGRTYSRKQRIRLDKPLACASTVYGVYDLPLGVITDPLIKSDFIRISAEIRIRRRVDRRHFTSSNGRYFVVRFGGLEVVRLRRFSLTRQRDSENGGDQ